jgi:hypothetical protein
MTESDYPAAHSMDAHWYTVDAQGNVAVFDAGSSGPVPKKAKCHESPNLVRLLWQLGGGKTVTDPDVDEFENETAFNELASVGVFAFECISSETGFVDPYRRTHQPGRPLHVDQLPPRLRKEFARLPLPVPDFAAAREIQIVEHVPCVLYRDEAVGYFAVGDKEVGPIPGKEKEYQAALPELRKQYREFRFAGGAAAPAKKEPLPRPRKRDDS